MAEQELERLVLRVEANVSRYERQLQRVENQAKRTTSTVERRFNNMSRNLNRSGAMFLSRFSAGIAAVAAPAALAAASQRTLQYAQDLESASERIGFSIERLQELRFAADQNGIATRALDMGLQRFSRRVAEAVNGQGELLATLRQYNIQLVDSEGNQRAINDILRDYADAIQGAGSQQEALRLAFKAFDSEGAALVEFLRGGSQALDDFGIQAREAGAVLEEGLIRQGAEAKRVIDEMRASIAGEFNRAILENAEEFGELAEAIGRVTTAAIRAGAAMARMLNLGAGQAGRDPEEAASTLREASQMLVLRSTGARRGDIRSEERLVRTAIGNVRGQEFNTDLREALREAGDNRQERNRVLLDFAERLRVEAQSVLDQAEAIAALDDELPGGGGRTNNAPPPVDPEAEEDKTKAALRVVARVAEEEERIADEKHQRELDRVKELGEEQARALAEALERDREAFVNLFAKTATGGVRAAFEGNLPEYAARRLQEALYDRLNTLFERLAEDIFNARNGEGGGGGFLSAAAGFLFGGGRSQGGPVSSNVAYRVGESGPEMFVPKRDGMIIPNQSPSLARSGGPISIRLEVDEGAMFEARVVDVAGPLAQRASVTAVAASRSDMQRQQSRSRKALR